MADVDSQKAKADTRKSKRKKKTQAVNAAASSGSSQNSNPPPNNIVGDEKQKIKREIEIAFAYNKDLRSFGQAFYSRLVQQNKLVLTEEGNPLPAVHIRSRSERPYDAMARLLEKNSKSCCAVCFDGESLLVAFNEKIFSEELFDQGNALLNHLLLEYSIRQMLLEQHISSIAKVAVKLKQKGIEPASAFFYGGEGYSVFMYRYMFLQKVLPLPFDISRPRMEAFFYNLMLRYMEFEKNSNSSPSTIVDEFWESFNDTYDLAKTLQSDPCGLKVEDMELLKRYLKDMINVENFIANLPLEHPILIKAAAEKQVFNLVSDGPEGMHAEMRLFSRLLEEGKKTPYIGISKLCCAHCNLAMTTAGILQVFLEQSENPGIGGYHGNGYIWLITDTLSQNETFLTHFLGTELMAAYMAFSEEKVLTDRKKRRIGTEKELALKIINYICIFKQADFKKHGFVEPYLLSNRDLYPPLAGLSTSENDELYADGYFLEKFGMLVAAKDIENIGVPKEFLVNEIKKVRILLPINEGGIQERAKANSLIYIHNTYNLYITTGQTGTFVISPHFFILRDNLNEEKQQELQQEEKYYEAAILFYRKIIEFYRYDETQYKSSLVIAYYNLGSFYLKINDPVRAKESFEKALKLDPTSQECVDKMVECEAIRDKLKIAAREKMNTRIMALQAAAEQGCIESQFKLASCYEYGISVPQNDQEAKKWYEEAALQGHEKARSRWATLNEKEARGHAQDEEYGQHVPVFSATLPTASPTVSGSSTLSPRPLSSDENLSLAELMRLNKSPISSSAKLSAAVSDKDQENDREPSLPTIGNP